MCKHRIVESHSEPADVRGFRGFKYQDLSEELAERIRSSGRPSPERLHRAESVWRHLGGILRGLARPTEAEIQADTYDGSVPISQWLKQNSK
jgi:hypothetical protein